MAAEVVLGGAVTGGAAFAEAVPDAVADDNDVASGRVRLMMRKQSAMKRTVGEIRTLLESRSGKLQGLVKGIEKEVR